MQTETTTEDDDILDLVEGEEGTTKEKETKVLDPNEDLRNAVAELTRLQTEAAKPKEKEEPELSKEQKDELWAVYDPKKSKKDFMKKFWKLNDEATPEEVSEAEEYFADMQKGLVRQAIKGSMNIHAAELQKLRDEIATRLDPIEKDYADTRAAKLRSDFSEAYPDFADPSYNKLLELSDKAQAGKQFKSREEYFKAVAETAAEAMKAQRPDFVLGAAKTKTTKTTGLTARSPRLVTGSGAGAGNNSGGGRGKDAVDDLDGIFDIP